MFGETRDRVNRMGGVKGWRERERERVRRMEEWRRDEEGGGVAEGKDSEEDGDRDGERESDVWEGEREWETKGREEEVDEDEV